MATSSSWFKRSLVGAALVLGVAALSLAIASQRGRRRSAEPTPEVAAELRSLHEDVAALQATLERQNQERTALAANAVLMAARQPASEPPAPTPPIPPASAAPSKDHALSAERMEAARTQQMEIQARYFDYLTGALTREPRDDAWAGPMESRVRSVLSESDFAGNSVREVECRRTLCKLVVKSTDRTATHGLLTFATRVPDLPNATYNQTVNADGTIVTSAFFAKQDATIPPPPKDLLADTSGGP